MQRPLIVLAIGAGLATPAAFGAFAAASMVSVDPGWMGALTLKKSVSLTLAAYPRMAQAAGSRVASSTDQRRVVPLPLRLSTRLPQDSAAAGELGGGVRSVAVDFPAASIPLIEPAQAALIDQARFWISEGREDLAELALTKLFQISQDNLQALEVLARIQLRRKTPEAANKVLDRMRRLQPNAAARASRVGKALRNAACHRGFVRPAKQSQFTYIVEAVYSN